MENPETYFDYMRRRLEGGESGVPATLGDKKATLNFAKLIGIAKSEEYYIGPISGLVLDELPEEFVLKPVYASTSIGIYLLRKESDGSLYDLVSQERLKLSDIVAAYNNIAKRYNKKPGDAHYIAEELLKSPEGTTPPPDIRAYAFQGECGFFLVEDHIKGKAEATYFNGDFSLMTDVRERFGIASGMEHLEEIVERPTPENYQEIINVTKRISTSIPTAFCRIDMYSTEKGIYLGELTFFPGTFYYHNRKIMKPVEAERLGKLWKEAELRLKGSKLTKPRI